MDYLTVKWLHILSATVLVGVGFGTAFFKMMADASKDARSMATVSHIVVIADWVFTTPAGFLQLATGLWLVHRAGFPLDTPWIVVSLVLYLLAGLCWLPVVVLQYKMRALARQSVATSEPIPATYRQYARIWFYLGLPAFAAMALIYALMVFKPTLWGG